ncbi:Concanavalin A-like lectin/glucanase, subgroup, partial [Cynara cardunculus var. scolymus]
TTSSPALIQLPSNVGTSHSFVGIVGGTRFVCALSSPFLSSSATLTSFLVCWRFLLDGRTVYKRVYLGPSLKDIDSGETHVCGIVSSTNQLLCWQWNQFNDFIPNRIQLRSSVAVGENYVCGLTEFGEIRCLGDYTNRFNTIKSFPVGNYSVVSAGYNRVCGIDSGGGLDCTDETMEKPNGVFKSVSIGDNRFCAIRVDGRVICWGENDFRLPENLQQFSFAGLQANRGVFCGILTTNYSLYCWGNESLNSISNSIVFEDVVPGLCTSSCACRTIPNYMTFCGSDLMICEPCVYGRAPPESPPPQNGGWSNQMVAYMVVGSIGCLSFVLVFVFMIFRFCKSSEGSRVHNSGPMEDIQIASQVQNSNRILVKKLSHLISMGNGNHLQEFALQTIMDATDNFSSDHRIGVGSFGSVYHAILNDGRKVAVKRAELTNPSRCAGGINKRQEDTNNAFVNELEFLSRVNHKNLVQLLGFCEENNELVLVYEYMENEEFDST